MATTRIACKLPNGLTIDHKTADDKVHKFTLKGANAPGALMGFGVTEVDADVFDDWMEKTGKGFPAVIKGLIFKLPARDTSGAIKERANDKTVKSGAEPIDPTKPARGIEATDEQKRELDKLDEEPGGQTVSVG